MRLSLGENLNLTVGSPVKANMHAVVDQKTKNFDDWEVKGTSYKLSNFFYLNYAYGKKDGKLKGGCIAQEMKWKGGTAAVFRN